MQASLRKSCRNAAFTQVCVKAACKRFTKAGSICTCVIAAFQQLLLIMTIFTKLCVKAVEKLAFPQMPIPTAFTKLLLSFSAASELCRSCRKASCFSQGRKVSPVKRLSPMTGFARELNQDNPFFPCLFNEFQVIIPTSH